MLTATVLLTWRRWPRSCRPSTTCWGPALWSPPTPPRSGRRTSLPEWTRIMTATWRRRNSWRDAYRTTSCLRCSLPTWPHNSGSHLVQISNARGHCSAVSECLALQTMDYCVFNKLLYTEELLWSCVVRLKAEKTVTKIMNNKL